MNRRDFVRAGAAAVALAAVGGGVAVQRYRATEGRASDRISGPWPELGEHAQWILPNLSGARMVVPDRPHDVQEARDPARRAAVRRVRRFTVTSSARRLRGDTAPELPSAGVTRIVAIGDSVTFGWGVADHESWPAQLAAELGRRGRSVEVLNAGVPAQQLPTMAAWLERVAPALAPAVVLFARRPPPGRGADEYADAIGRARRALPRARVHVLLPPVSRFDPFGCSVWESEASQLASRVGVPVLDLTPAMRAAQGDQGAKLEIAGSTTRVLSASGAVLLEAPTAPRGLHASVYALFESDPTVREALFFDDGHPDAAGFAALVRTIADRVDELKWAG